MIYIKLLIKLSLGNINYKLNSLNVILGMQQTVVEYMDANVKERVEEEIFSLLRLPHSPRQGLTSPHQLSLSDAENHTVRLFRISWHDKLLNEIFGQKCTTMHVFIINCFISAVYFHERYL